VFFVDNIIIYSNSKLRKNYSKEIAVCLEKKNEYAEHNLYEATII